MIKNPKIVEIVGTEFHINNISPLTALAVLKKLTGLVGSVFNSDSQTEVFSALGTALKSLEDKELNVLFLQLFSCVQVVPPGEPPFLIDSEAAFNKAGQ